MNLTIPIYVTETRRRGTHAPLFAMRPLFFPSPVVQSDNLGRASAKLAGELRIQLEQLGRQARQENFLGRTFCPMTEEHAVSFKVELPKQTVRCSFLAVSFEAIDRRFAFAPSLPGLWFDVPRGKKVAARAQEVLLELVRENLKDDEEYHLPAALTESAREWITSIDLDVSTRPDLKKQAHSFLMALGAPPTRDGREELRKVGRCLDWLYPDDLDRVVLRDTEVEELASLLAAPDRRPVLLVGPRKVGKTAIIHECVFRRVQQHGKPYSNKRNVWLLSPPRLISGMMYLGQWENRLLAILEEARKQDHVLFFEDLLGLQQAGMTRDSDLNVAAVMRPFVERREFRMLGEITPEALRVLRETDRAMADLFHILPVREPGDEQTRRILLNVARQIEGKRDCRFALDVLPAVIQLQRRFVREQAFPGKAAGFLHALAGKYARQEVTRRNALDEFSAGSGLSLGFLDEFTKLNRNEVLEALGREIVGQESAIGAMADAITVAKARLNDPGRPIGSFLFLGPTGVGKTHCAKALAAYLYGNADRIVRFDMNEFVDGASVTRLVGTFYEPEGLLTAAIRRQPFCVLLLDEIEKAHPAVFDLLLQVLGEGRLSDALGRTADFTNCIVIMTSNLGVREAGTSFGLRPSGIGAAGVFVAAAEKFFRPEFFNRIDRIVPFSELDRGQLERVALARINALFSRDGLVHRRCVLRVGEPAMRRLVAEGHHPQLGARALKRVIEKQLAQPVAARLATMPPKTPAVITLHAGRDEIAVSVQPLIHAERGSTRAVDLTEVDFLLDGAEAACDRIDGQIAQWEPAGHLTQGSLSAEQFRYLAVREQIERARESVRYLDRKNAAPRPDRSVHRAPVRRGHHFNRVRRLRSYGNIFQEILGAENIRSNLADLAATVETSTAQPQEPAIRQLVEDMALLEQMAAPGHDRCLLWIHSMGHETKHHELELRRAFELLFIHQPSATVTWLKLEEHPSDAYFLLFEVPAAAAILAGEAGTHLIIPNHGNIVPVQVRLCPLESNDDPATVAASFHADQRSWESALAAGSATPEDDPFPVGPVVRIYEEKGPTIDLRSGLICQRWPNNDEFRAFVLAQLPLPREMIEQD